MLRPAIAEEARLFAIGAKPKIGDGADAGPRQPLADIAGKVEMGLAGALISDEEGRAFRLLGKEALEIFPADLVGLLRDGGANNGGNAFRLGAELGHGCDGGLDDA